MEITQVKIFKIFKIFKKNALNVQLRNPCFHVSLGLLNRPKIVSLNIKKLLVTSETSPAYMLGKMFV